MEKAPPPRAPHYDFHEEGWGSARDAAIDLIDRFVRVVERDPNWIGPGLEARLAVFENAKDGATIAFTSNRGDGRIELSINPQHWICAEAYLGDTLFCRAWGECGYEEPEFWPDGSDGVHRVPEGFTVAEAGARMSKRLVWITFFQWPNWPRFSLEIAGLDD